MAAETAEAVTIELIGNLDQLRRTTKQGADEFGTQMNRIKTSADQAERSVEQSMMRTGISVKQAANQSRTLGIQLGQIGSQLSVGTSPFLILAQQSSDLAYVLEGSAGAVGKVARFFMTWQGALVLVAGTLAAQFLPKLFETNNALNDEIEKLKDAAEKAEVADRAHDAFGQTLEGVTQALADNEEALQKLGLAEDTSAEKTLAAAEAARTRLITIREETEALLRQAVANEKVLISTGALGAADPNAAQAAISAASGRISDLEADLQNAQIQLNLARSQIIRATAAVTVEAAGATEIEQINRKYDQQIDLASERAVVERRVGDELRRQVEAINAQREAELRRARDRQREHQSSQSLPPVTRAEVANAIGTSIISGQRSPGHNREVGGAANSFHLGGPTAAVQAIDIPLTVNGRPLTKPAIRQMLEPLGVVIRELLGPGDRGHSDHFHIAFERTRQGADKIAETAQRVLEAEERRRQTFENERASLQDGELEARRALISGIKEVAQYQIQDIELARQKYNDNLESLVVQQKLTEDEATELRGINDERAKLREQLVLRNRDEALFRSREAALRNAAEFGSAQRSDQADLLQSQQDMASTARERREIEARLLDLQYQEERARNDYLIAFYERLKTVKGIGESELAEARTAAQIAELRNRSIGVRHDAERQQLDRSTPFGRYLDEISDIETRAEEATVRELQAVRDGITEALAEELGIKNSYVKELFSIFLDEVVFRPLAEALQRRQAGGFFGSILSLVGGLLGGGGPTNLLPAGYRASGGAVSAGMPYVVGEGGRPELFVPSQSGVILSNRQLRGGGGEAGSAVVRLELSGDIDARIQRVSGPVAVQVVRAAQPSLTEIATNEMMGRLGRPTL